MELSGAPATYINTMKTIVTTSPEVAAQFIHSGELAAFPTETVYGLGAHALIDSAVQKIFEAKGRPPDNPLIVHIFNIDQLDDVVADVPLHARQLMERFLPGPLTVVLPKSPRIPAAVTAGLDSVGVRMPDHGLANTFLKACGIPVAAPSANRSGRPSPTMWQDVLEDLDGRIACILKGERAPLGLESTVVDCTGAEPVVLRAGAVSVEDLQRVVGSTRAARPSNESVVRSPGLRHRHYAPRARVHLVHYPPADPGNRSAYIGISAPPLLHRFERILVCSDLREYAYELFGFFRMCDRAAIQTIYCEVPTENGLGGALADRLRRASESTS